MLKKLIHLLFISLIFSSCATQHSRSKQGVREALRSILGEIRQCGSGIWNYTVREDLYLEFVVRGDGKVEKIKMRSFDGKNKLEPIYPCIYDVISMLKFEKESQDIDLTVKQKINLKFN